MLARHGQVESAGGASISGASLPASSCVKWSCPEHSLLLASPTVETSGCWFCSSSCSLLQFSWPSWVSDYGFSATTSSPQTSLLPSAIQWDCGSSTASSSFWLHGWVLCFVCPLLQRIISLGQEDPMEKEMATHFSALAWKIPWTEEPGIPLQSMGLQRVGHDWASSLSFQRIKSGIRKTMGCPGDLDSKESACQCRRPGFDPWVGKLPWRREWLPIPVFLPGESHGQKSLAGYSSRGHKESDMTEQPTLPT